MASMPPERGTLQGVHTTNAGVAPWQACQLQNQQQQPRSLGTYITSCKVPKEL
jgi:hypothetical protein